MSCPSAPLVSTVHIGPTLTRRYVYLSLAVLITRTDLESTQGQYVDGLRTAVVIHPESEVHSYDDEYTIIISDWYHDQHDALLTQFISISNPGGAEPVPGMFLRPLTSQLLD